LVIVKLESMNSSRRIQMGTDLIHDRGCGAEIRGTRITVHDLLHHFLDPSETEAYICHLYDLTAEQVAAARAYVLNHADHVLAEHLQIEARIAAGNPPEVTERAKKARSTLLSFKEWLADREEAASQQQTAELPLEDTRNGATNLPTFKEWMAERQARPKDGS
jgi:uncharacterized protein (DUF433 family)